MKQLYIAIVVVLALLTMGSAQASCSRWLCGGDTPTLTGASVDGMTWAQIHDELQAPYVSNLHSWNMSTRFVNGTNNITWPPWYIYDNDMDVANLKDTYTQSWVGVNANFTLNTAVTDESSELFMAAVMNWSYTNITEFNNYLEACKDTTSGHNTNLTSWICSHNGSNIYKNDENSASDATARLATGFFMCALNPSLTTAQRTWCRSRGVNITNAAIAEEFVTSCHTSPIAGAPQLCKWRLAGAAQAWGGGALTQVGQQMFVGYHESDVMNFLAAYAATHNDTYSQYAKNETHQFLYIMQYDGSGSLSADYTQPVKNLNYYMVCSSEPCYAESTYDNNGFDDADAPRTWEMCNNVEYARLVYSTYGEAIPWEFQNLSAYCNAWSTRVLNYNSLATSGTQLVNGSHVCSQISDTGTCRVIADNKQYREIAWGSNLVAFKQDRTFYTALIKGPLVQYDKTNDYYTGSSGGTGSPVIRGYGVYGQVRNLRSLRYATGYYEYLFTNSTFSYTNWAASSTGGPANTGVNACFFAPGP